ncbi:MAG: glycoside hydrolase family 88 protein [Bacteroidota bacterium]
MKKYFLLYSLVLCCMLAASSSAQTKTVQAEALDASRRVADKLIRDTRFSLTLVPQKEELGMQVVDFREMIRGTDQTAYALRSCVASKDTMVRFGVSHGASVTIWVNGRQVYCATEHTLKTPKEEAYNRFTFQHYFSAVFTKGVNEISIRYRSGNTQPVVFIRAQLPVGDLDNALRFDNLPAKQWLLLGPFGKNDTALLKQQTIQSYYTVGRKQYNWQSQPQRMLPDLLIDSTLTYQRDPYLDWNYSNGNTVWSTLQLTEATGNKIYKDYVDRYTGYMMDHMAYFRKQYDSLFEFRGSFHRFFRMSMLDDAGSAVLPYIDLYRINHNESIRKQILEPVADYILHRQVRLGDGTFCRPEPVTFTVWCDDLFMSVPFLLRWAEITHDKNYYDESVRQFRGFRKHLLDTDTKLFYHGWFSNTQKNSPVHWGRANGWIAWATMELLEHLPKTHEGYSEILASFKEQMMVLKGYQEKNGMWHQVLDRPASFEETSCTAMFTMAMAKGVRMGWLDNSYRDHAIRGWQAVQKKIEKDGTVHDICRGTEIGFDESFYFERKRFDQDPRGLGAVIAAGTEVSKMK